MRQLLRSDGTLAAIVLASFILAGFAGCSGCSSLNKTAYRTTGVTVVSVDAVMTAWGVYVSKNHPGAAVEKKVSDAYQKYQASVTIVADAAIAYQKAKEKNDPSLPTAQANLNAVLAASAAALSDLTQLVVSLGAKV